MIVSQLNGLPDVSLMVARTMVGFFLLASEVAEANGLQSVGTRLLYQQHYALYLNQFGVIPSVSFPQH